MFQKRFSHAVLRAAVGRIASRLVRHASVDLARRNVTVAEAMESRRLLASVTSSVFDFQGTSQGLDYTFDAAVPAADVLGSLSIVDLARGVTLPRGQLAATSTGTNTARVTWPGLPATTGSPRATPAGILPDGHFEAIVEDGVGSPFATPSVKSFLFYMGDTDGDGDVDNLDSLRYRSGVAGGRPITYLWGDFDYSGTIDSADYDLFASRFGTMLTPIPAGANTLTAGSNTVSTITLNFTAPIDSATGVPSTLFTGFNVYRSLDGVNFAQVNADYDPALARDGRAIYTYTDTGLIDGTKYWYRVRPYNSDATNGAAVGLWHTTNKLWSVTVLPMPGNVAAVAASQTAIDVSWEDGSTTAEAFVVERSDDGGETFATVGTVTGETFHDDTVAPDTIYQYRVQAMNGPKESAFTLPVSVTTPGIPTAATGLTATATAGPRVSLAWQDRSATESGFRVERRTPSGAWAIRGTAPANATTFVDSTVEALTAYEYRVTAINALGAATPTNAATVTTLAANPPTSAAAAGLTATYSNVKDGIDFTWSTPSGIASGDVIYYELQRQRQDGTDWYTVAATDYHPSASSLKLTDSTAQRGQTYVYRVTTWVAGAIDAEMSPVGTLGPVTVDYAVRPEFSWTSGGVTITWPIGHVPPPTLDIVVTNPNTGESRTISAPLSPPGDSGSGGSGDYNIDDLDPDTDYDISFDDPNSSGSGSNDGDGVRRVRTRTFADEVTVQNYLGELYPGVRRTIGPSRTLIDDYTGEEYEEQGIVRHDGQSITYDFSNLPEHTYVKMTGKLAFFRRPLDENESGTPKSLEQLLNDVTIGGTAVGESIQETARAIPPLYEYGGRTYPDELNVLFGTGWVESKGAKTTASVLIGGMGVGWLAQMETLQVEIGTPRYDVDFPVSLQEKRDDDSGKTFRLRRANTTAIDQDLTVPISLKTGEGRASSADVNLPSEAVFKKNQQLSEPITIKSIDDLLDENHTDVDHNTVVGVENIVIELGIGTNRQELKIGTIDDDVNVQSVTFSFDPVFTPLPGSPPIQPRVVGLNGYAYYNTLRIKGEHLDLVKWKQKINSYTWATNFYGNLVPTDILEREWFENTNGQPYTNTNGKSVEDWGERDDGTVGPMGWVSIQYFPSKKWATTAGDNHALIGPSRKNHPYAPGVWIAHNMGAKRDFEVGFFDARDNVELGYKYNYGIEWTNSSYYKNVPSPMEGGDTLKFAIETASGAGSGMIKGYGEGTGLFSGFAYSPHIETIG